MKPNFPKSKVVLYQAPEHANFTLFLSEPDYYIFLGGQTADLLVL